MGHLQPSAVDLAGTNWKLVYTTSTAASSGKIGPFVGFVEQVRPAVSFCVLACGAMSPLQELRKRCVQQLWK